jgi:uncharacterized protein involved in response to NO
MGPLMSVTRCVRKLAFPCLLLAASTLGITPAFSAGANAETIQAAYIQAGNLVSVTLVIDNYSTPSDLQILSQAFNDGHDQGLVTALSKTKAVGHCSIAGAQSYDIAFIQMVVIPIGRRITFITNRPLQFGEAKSDSPSPAYDLAVGQFDLNDTDAAKSTGFLFPASKLVIDKQGEFHYDLAGTPLPLVNVLDSKAIPSEILAQVPAK